MHAFQVFAGRRALVVTVALMACSTGTTTTTTRVPVTAAPPPSRTQPVPAFNTTATADWLDEIPCFEAAGLAPEEKRARYVALIEQGIPTSEIQLIRNALQRGQLTGNSVFVDEIEKITGLRITNRGRGRPW